VFEGEGEGVLVGDAILAIDDQDVSKWPLAKIGPALRGTRGEFGECGKEGWAGLGRSCGHETMRPKRIWPAGSLLTANECRHVSQPLRALMR
jgi:hypothetical protein